MNGSRFRPIIKHPVKSGSRDIMYTCKHVIQYATDGTTFFTCLLGCVVVVVVVVVVVYGGGGGRFVTEGSTPKSSSGGLK